MNPLIKKILVILSTIAILCLLGFYYFMWGGNTSHENLNSVNTKFKLLGSDHKIELAKFYDPDTKNIACYINRAKTGGITGTLGVAEDNADASMSCVQLGKIDLKNIDTDSKQVFTERRSVGFKTLQVVRVFDDKNGVFIYTAYSDKIIDGDSISATSAIYVNNDAFAK